MKKRLLNFVIMALLGVSTLWADGIAGGTKLFFTPSENWQEADARFAAYFFGAEGSAWAGCTVNNPTGPVYQVVAPAGVWTNVIFCRMDPATTVNDWGNKWNQTDDLVYDGTRNYYTRAEGIWDGPGGTWGVYNDPTTEPQVYISAPSWVYVDETITLSAVSENVADPIYAFLVKTPNAVEFAYIASPYTPADGIGTYEFMVELWDGSTIAATDAAEVLVRDIPADITIKVNASNTGWTNLAIWNWSDGVDGNFVIPAEDTPGFYSYTFSRREPLGIIFVDSDGTAWPDDLDFDTRVGRQTVNAEGIAADACFIIGAQAFVDGDPDYAKRVLLNVDCADINEAMVELVAPARVYEDEGIMLSAHSLNIEEAEYTYFVITPETFDFEEITALPYFPTDGPGEYFFKVEAISAVGIAFAEMEATVDVLPVPDPITITVDIAATGWDSIAIWYWNYGNFGAFAVPELVSGTVYEYTFDRIDVLNLIFVESGGNGWPVDVDPEVRAGKQTVNVEDITANACYVIGDQIVNEDGTLGSREVSACIEEIAPRVKAAPRVTTVSTDQRIELSFEGSAQVEIYTISGILLNSQTVEGRFNYPAAKGTYVVRVNDEVQKIMVK